MSLTCNECGTEVESERSVAAAFASKYEYECPDCGNEWVRTKFS